MGTVGTILVNTEGLVAKSVELRKKVNLLSTQFERMNTLMQKTEGYWLGEAGNFHRNMYNQSVENEKSLIKRLEEYSADLVQIAGNYSSTEKKLTQEAGALPGDVVQ